MDSYQDLKHQQCSYPYIHIIQYHQRFLLAYRIHFLIYDIEFQLQLQHKQRILNKKIKLFDKVLEK